MNETPKLLNWVGGLSIAAGLVHGALTDAHFAQWWAFGVFFMLAATGQALYGFAILASHVLNGAPISERWPVHARRIFYAMGIAANTALVLTYVASRTIGVLAPPEPWEPLGVFTQILEIATVAVLIALLARAMRAPARPVSAP